MRWWILLFIIGLLGCGRSDSGGNATPEPTTTPAQTVFEVLIADAQHALRPNDTSSRPYLLKAGSGIVLDAKKLVFVDPLKQGRLPNAVQVLYRKSVYSADWPEFGEQIGTLNSSTLRTLKGSPFEGFAAGQQAYIAIGHQWTDSKTQEIRFCPFWMASVLFY